MDGAVVRGSAPVGVSVRGARVVKVAAGLVLVETVVVLLGWAGGLEGLTTLGMGSTSMKLNTALCLGGLSVSLLSSRRPGCSQPPALVAAVVAWVAVLGYAYGAEDLHGVGAFQPMAMPTALAVLVVAVAQLVRVPGGALPWVLFGRDPGAVLQRQ